MQCSISLKVVLSHSLVIVFGDCIIVSIDYKIIESNSANLDNDMRSLTFTLFII